MRILHVLGTDRLSGAEKVHLDILAALSQDNEAAYASPDGEIRRYVEAAGVRFIPCDTDDISALRALYDREKPDVVHAADPRMSFRCARAKIPYIAHLHCNCPWMKKYSTQSFALRYAAKRAVAVIAISPEIADSYVFKKALLPKLCILPNAVDRERITELSRAPFDKEYDLLFVGRLSPVKRPHLFLELVKRVSEVYPELRAALVGDGELRGGVERLIEERGLKNVSLIGFDPNPYRIMARSKIVAMTSEYEGFGLVAAEAMTLSKPVLALPAGGIDEIARLAGGLCADIDDMAEKAAQLLTDAGKYDAASEAAYRASFAYTDTEAYYSKIKEIYAEAAKVVK